MKVCQICNEEKTFEQDPIAAEVYNITLPDFSRLCNYTYKIVLDNNSSRLTKVTVS